MQVFSIGFQSSYTFSGLISSSLETKSQASFLGLSFDGTGAAVAEGPAFMPALQEAVNNNTLVLVLDGSEDFTTKKMIAKGLGLPLVEFPQARTALESYCRQTGRTVSGRLAEGTLLPQGAVPMTSGDTVDQGFILTRGNRCIAVFPASKKGFGSMFSTGLFPFLVQAANSAVCQRETYLLPGKEELVENYLHSTRPGKGVFPAMFAQNGQSCLRVTAVRKTQAEADSACASFLEDLASEAGKVTCSAPANAHQQKKGEKAALKAEKAEQKAAKKAAKKNPYQDYNPAPAPSGGHRRQREKTSFGEKLRRVLLVCCCLTFLGSVGYLGFRYVRSANNIKTYANLREVYDSGGVPPLDYPWGYDNDFAALYQINPDVAGWISIEGTSLDYPVVQTADNTTYERKNFEGEKNLHGVPFVDYSVDLQEPSTNIVIYGHNIKNDDQMFNSLLHYWQPDYFKAHPIVEFNSVYHKGKYKIFAAFVANVNPDHGAVFQYHQFIDAMDVSEVQEYINQVKLRSIINTGVDVLPSDELLTLSTCTYEFDNARFVVVARKLRPGEEEAIDETQVYKTKSPLMPDIWYQLYGGTPPDVAVALLQISQDAQRTLDKLESANRPEEETAPEPPAKTKPEAPEPQAEETAPPEETVAPQTTSTEEAPPVQQETAPPAGPQTPAQTLETTPSQQAPPPKTEAPPTVEPEPDEPATPSQSQPEDDDPEDDELDEGNLDEGNSEDKPQNQDDDDDAPSYNSRETLSVKLNGKTTKDTAYNIVSVMVQAEMGSSFEPEALKAQAVAAYTYVKYNNQAGVSPWVACKTPVSANVKKAVESVLGEAVLYKGSYANTTYCAANAGVTNDSRSVWGGSVPYLTSVESPGDKKTSHYGTVTSLSRKYVADRIEDYHNIDPYDWDDDPSEWFGSYDCDLGLYVSDIDVCGRSLTGRQVREGLLQSKIKSAAFEVEYNEAKDTFEFTTYGYGHGVGMSQLGANYYAQKGWDYIEILEYYYPGTRVK